MPPVAELWPLWRLAVHLTADFEDEEAGIEEWRKARGSEDSWRKTTTCCLVPVTTKLDAGTTKLGKGGRGFFILLSHCFCFTLVD